MLNGEATPEGRGRPRSLSIHPVGQRSRSRTPSFDPLAARDDISVRETSSVHSDPSTSRRHRGHHSSHERSQSAGPSRPKKGRILGSNPLVSIPGRIILTMLNTGIFPVVEESKALAALANKPVSTESFIKHVELRRRYPVLLKVEFQMASKPEGQHSCRHALKAANAEKNQNQKIIPYDYNRVVLDPLPGEEDSDYVNASYVDSLVNPKAYIVAQGPNEATVADFWRMVWQNNVTFIVMLTKTFDFIKVMCVQYWPAAIGKEETYNGIRVTVSTEEQIANFMIRTIKLKLGEEERSLHQFHYTEWSSHSCPFSNALLEFRRRIRIYLRKFPTEGPVLVHCSDGGGRSGVFITLDANLEQSEEDGMFNIYGYLKKIRSARKGLIETVEQYKFVHETLEEFLMCGSTWFPVSQLSDRLKFKSTKNPKTKMSEYQKEFNQMNKMAPKFSIGDCAGGHRPENRDKNRDVITVPPDNFRPYLSSFQGNCCTDYINAVFVDGYSHPREYFVTEWPALATMQNLWSLVYDYDCSAVVVLCTPDNQAQYPQFWPDSNKVKKYGPVFSVERVQEKSYNNIKSWIFRISKKIVALTELMAGIKAETKTCQLFQLTCWPIGNLVPTSTNSLVELMNMVEHWRQKTDYGPVVVVSLDGRARAGVYCAANACIEQVVQHEEVDVFQAVKTVRRHRPQLVENITEYKYCYDLVLHYVLHYLHKK